MLHPCTACRKYEETLFAAVTAQRTATSSAVEQGENLARAHDTACATVSVLRRCSKRGRPKAPVNSSSADTALPWSRDANAPVNSDIVPHMIRAPKTPFEVLPAATAARTKAPTSTAP